MSTSWARGGKIGDARAGWWGLVSLFVFIYIPALRAFRHYLTVDTFLSNLMENGIFRLLGFF